MRNIDSWLFNIFDEKNRKNNLYSLRSFARDIDTSVSYLSKVFNGKNQISLTKAKEFCEVLKISPENRSEIIQNYIEIEEINKTIDTLVQNELKKGIPHKNILGITAKDCIKISHWYSALILHKAPSIKGIESERITKLANILHIDEIIVQDTIQEFIRIGLLRKEKNNYKKIYDDFYLITEGDAIMHHKLTKNHLESSLKLLQKPQGLSYGHDQGLNSFEYMFIPVKSKDFIYEKLYFDFYSETKNKYSKTDKNLDQTYCIQLYFTTMRDWKETK